MTINTVLESHLMKLLQPSYLGGIFPSQAWVIFACLEISVSKAKLKTRRPNSFPYDPLLVDESRFLSHSNPLFKSDNKLLSSSGPKSNSNKYFAQAIQCSYKNNYLPFHQSYILTGLDGVDLIVQTGNPVCFGEA